MKQRKLRSLTVSMAWVLFSMPVSVAWAESPLAEDVLKSEKPVETTTTEAPITSVENLVTSEAEPVQIDLSTHLPARVKLYYGTTVSKLYSVNQLKPFWQDEKAVGQFQRQLAELALSGIQPQFYQWVTWLTDPGISGIARDIVLTDAMMGYLDYVSRVPANGRNWLYSARPYKMAEPSDIVVQQWMQSYKDADMSSYVSRLAPQHPQYEKMGAVLKSTLVKVGGSAWPQISTEGGSIRPGATHRDIPAIREMMHRYNLLDSPAVKREETSVAAITEELSTDSKRATDTNGVAQGSTKYSEDLVQAVKRFQEWKGLQPDGIIGKRTKEWLNISPQSRVGLLALNIQRLRILPGTIDTGIMVNIPDYSLIYYQNGAEVLTSRVIVGSPARKTPLMDSELNNVVLNPPWNVPVKLTQQDIIPKVKRDPSYLQRHNYTVLSGWSGNAEVVDPSTIDWSNVSANNFRYRLKQAPGRGNSLGRYKFNMPNSEAIYLHDTPNHRLFDKDIRALSSGCVRVNKASELAKMLLQDSGWSENRISSTLKKGNTTYANVQHKIPVQLYYLTAWVSDDGRPQYRTDIYNYDTVVRTTSQILPQAEILLR